MGLRYCAWLVDSDMRQDIVQAWRAKSGSASGGVSLLSCTGLTPIGIISEHGALLDRHSIVASFNIACK